MSGYGVDGERIARTAALVEANSFEALALWSEYAEDGTLAPVDGRDRGERLTWEQDNRGFWTTIGRCDGRPVCVSLFWSTIGGDLVCFWEATSEVVDFAMVRAWLSSTFPKHVRRTDAMNFHNAFESWPPTARRGGR